MKTNKVILTIAALTILGMTSCGGDKQSKGLADGASGNLEAYEQSDVNAVVQALPQIMVIPGDQILHKFNCINTDTVNGRLYVIRDFRNYLLKDDRARRIISTIQDSFNENNFPLNDFEQTLKQLDTQEALEMADDIDKDAKTLLLFTVRPDIILELNYNTSRDNGLSMISHNYNHTGEKNVSYTLTALDAYTNMSVATITASNLKGESTTETIQTDMKKRLPKFQQDIQKYFS